MSAIIRALAACLAIAPLACGAVSLDPQGVGQALIFPYYTVRSTDGNAFNTFVSIANSSADAKALRVRFREGRNSREVASFNLFLAPGGIWTGALVPSGDGARLVSADQSCTSPAFASAPGSLPFLDFSDASYAGANADGAGTGLDRTREGYVEAIEMATLTGASAQQAAFTGTSLATPANCGALRNAATLETAAPSGGLSGTLTVINVDAGRDFTVNADALANLASRPFYRPIADPYPDFDVTEVDAYSTGIVEGKVYRATWSRGVDAVSSALIASVIENEFVIDAATRSRTDWIVTLPTRRFYGSGTTVAAPFSPPFSDTACPSQEVLLNDLFNREIAFLPVDTAGAFGAPSAPPVALCWSVTTIPMINGSFFATKGPFGSANALVDFRLHVPSTFQNGWMRLTLKGSVGIGNFGKIVSRSDSVLMDSATGTTTTGPLVFTGLPALGFMARTFENGTLPCGGFVCQGNYGGGFTHRYSRNVAPAP